MHQLMDNNMRKLQLDHVVVLHPHPVNRTERTVITPHNHRHHTACSHLRSRRKTRNPTLYFDVPPAALLQQPGTTLPEPRRAPLLRRLLLHHNFSSGLCAARPESKGLNDVCGAGEHLETRKKCHLKRTKKSRAGL